MRVVKTLTGLLVFFLSVLIQRYAIIALFHRVRGGRSKPHSVEVDIDLDQQINEGMCALYEYRTNKRYSPS